MVNNTVKLQEICQIKEEADEKRIFQSFKNICISDYALKL